MANEEKPVRGPGRKFVKKDQPTAATSGDTSASSAASPGFESGGFVMAMAHVLRGKTVRRRAWVGQKSVSKDHPSGRVILETADLVATDWPVV